MIFCPRYAHYFSFLFGCTFRLFFFFLRIDRIQSIVLILLFTMHPNINNTGHIKIPVHMHTDEFITLLILSLCCFFSYSFLMFINPYLLLYLVISPIPFYTSPTSILSDFTSYILLKIPYIPCCVIPDNMRKYCLK
jgi:hypothetical protein